PAQLEDRDGSGERDSRNLRRGDLLHRGYPGSGADEILAEVLREAGARAGENGGALSGHQGHGRIVPPVRGSCAGESLEGGGGTADPFPYTRYQWSERG